MSSTPPDPSQEPYEPHPNNFFRDRKRMRQQYGPYSYTRGYYFEGTQTPLKPRNIRITSSIPIVFGVLSAGFGAWAIISGKELAGGLVFLGFALFCWFMSWVGFRTARIREKWERENPELAKNIEY